MEATHDRSLSLLSSPDGADISLLQHCFYARHLIFLCKNIWQRTNWRNLVLIDLPVALRIVLLDVIKLCRILERRVVPVQVPHPLVKIGVATPNVTNVALEVLYVDGVEAHNRGVKTNIGFRDCGRGEEIRGG
jgi:hypothetical protein